MHILVIFAVIFTKRWKWLTNIRVNELTFYNQNDLNKIRTSFIHMKEVYGNFRDLSQFDFDLAANKFTLQQETYIEQVEDLVKCAVLKKNRIVMYCSRYRDEEHMDLANKFINILIYNTRICENIVYCVKRSIRSMVRKQKDFNVQLRGIDYTPYDFVSLEVLTA